MMEDPLSQGASPSGENTFSVGGELNSPTIVNLDERLLDISARQSLNIIRTPPTKKAKRVRFFRNGDKFYTGVVMAVTPQKYRSFDSLASDLTRALISSVTLPNGVRAIYTMDGRKVHSVNDLEDGKCYVVSGQGEIFKKVEYSSTKVRRGSSLSGLPQSPAGTGRQISAIPLCVKAKIITLIRHGTKPRKVVRLLLNKRNAPSLEHAMEAITEAVKLDSGAVRKVFNLSGQQVTSLEQFFENDEIFLAYGPEKSNQEDFELDFEESKCVQSFRRCPWTSKRQNGPMPRMPRKSGKKVLSTPQVRTPSPSTLILPQPLRLHYAVGHVIGDGNFAVVRHCTHKSSGAEYAMKIVDKYKCQGKETMLASEVAILRQVCHPNIISLISEQETTDQLFLVMELVKGGDLFDAIAAATKFSESQASIMIGHLTSALAYLHSHHIVHRDVKPENLLVEMDGGHVRCLKLGDFGLAQVVKEPLYTVCGTPTYVAPEILAQTGYGLKIDVWAAGVILYILLCGFPPFVSPENEQEELFERILSGQYEFTSPYWDTVSDSAKQLISNMLQAQPELRFSAEDVLDHPWLASFLGGEQTTASTPTNSKEQHWDQQYKQIRVATFEFDFKKQTRSDGSQHQPDTSDDKTDFRNTWKEPLLSVQSKNNVQHNVINKAQEYRRMDRDEVDFNNGNRSDDEPLSLSADCLQDIHNLSSSSLSSIHDNVYLSTQTDNTFLLPCGNNRSSSIDIDAHQGRSPAPTLVTSTNRTNGNSGTEKRSITPTTLEALVSSYVDNFGTPKSGKTKINRQRHKNRLLPEIEVTSEKVKSKLGIDDVKNQNTVSSSAESLTGSSGNDIETSDSFVNIQFAQLAQGQKSSSTQSMESTDSFENIRFNYTQDTRNDNIRDSNQNNCIQGTLQAINDSKNTVPTNMEKTTRKLLQPRAVIKTNVFKPASLNSYQQSNNATKQSETLKFTKNETVRVRGERSAIRNEDNSKNVARTKRYSCFPTCSAQKLEEPTESKDKLACPVSRVARKFNSTDELREDKQKQIVKPKRYSLYYTPQPLRKHYEVENKSVKNTGRSISTTRNDGENSGKTDVNTKKDDTAEVDGKKNMKIRRVVVEGSTIASRSKMNKQSVHVKSNFVNPTLIPGRTK